jgi:RimJ/RimL family protein N-acetyltransferase
MGRFGEPGFNLYHAGADEVIKLGNHDHGVRIAGKAKCQYHPESDVVFSNSRGNELLGGFIFTDYTGNAVNLHMASFDKRWLSPSMLWVLFDYPFVKLGCSKLVAQIRSGNLTAIAFARHLGLNEETRLGGIFPGEDLVFVSLRREHCRWLGMRKRELNSGQ